MSDDQDINDQVGDALSSAVAQDSEMVTKWLAIVEVVDANGERWIRLMTNTGAKAWDNLGLLSFALQREQSAMVVADINLH